MDASVRDLSFLLVLDAVFEALVGTAVLVAAYGVQTATPDSPRGPDPALLVLAAALFALVPLLLLLAWRPRPRLVLCVAAANVACGVIIGIGLVFAPAGDSVAIPLGIGTVAAVLVLLGALQWRARPRSS